MIVSLNDATGTSAARLARLGIWTIILVLVAVYSTANASAGDKADTRVVALAYDTGTGSLVKSDRKALHRSLDDGQTWQTIPLPASAKGNIATIATPAEGNGVIYVAGRGLGVRRTEDDGASWVTLNEGLPSTEVTALAPHATQPETLYVYLPKNGIYRSQDAGRSWKLMDSGPDNIRQLIHTNMEGSMETGWLYAATAQGVRFSMDCFCLWRDAGELTGEVYSLAYDPEKPKHLFAASKQGLFRSTNGGQEWEQAASPETAVTALTLTPSGVLYAATHNGQMFRSVDGAETWEGIGD